MGKKQESEGVFQTALNFIKQFADKDKWASGLAVRARSKASAGFVRAQNDVALTRRRS